MLWGHTLRSPHAHARVVAVDVSAALAMPGVHAVLTHDDVRGTDRYRRHALQVLTERALKRVLV
jgi:CO/xanthine dehydrogenase Mo-binding subunit